MDIKWYLTNVRYYPFRDKNEFLFEMAENNQNDVYNELYRQAKFTIEEIGQFPDFQNLKDDELGIISDLLFDIGITAQKIMIENND